MKYQKIGNKQRKHLSADALFSRIHNSFSRIADHRKGEVDITLPDALMSGFAMFSLKDPSLLAFDERRGVDENLMRIFHIGQVPCDTHMRTTLDNVDPESIRVAYKDVFRQVQRGKAFEPMVFMEGCYLLSLDGTGYFTSEKIHSESCMEKISSKTGKVTFYQQMMGAAIVHPDFKEVIPFAPEPIVKQDGQSKNDCERNAAKRFFEKLKRDHPRLPLIITEDGLSSNAPHIREIEKHGWRYILGMKQGDHTFLFEQVTMAQQNGQTMEFEVADEKNQEMTHRFRFLNQVPLNESNQDLLVNFVEYWEITDVKTRHWCWITDFTITKKNVYQIMRGGRARWKIENETFNTLKNQGYNFEHNYGLGKKNLSVVFAMLMMLAFLVDQVQQLCCPLFRAVWKKLGSKRALWESIRAFLKCFQFDLMEALYKALLYGIKLQPPLLDTS